MGRKNTQRAKCATDHIHIMKDPKICVFILLCMAGKNQMCDRKQILNKDSFTGSIQIIKSKETKN